MVRRETVPDRRVEKNRLRSNVGVARQVGAELGLHEAIAAKKLIECYEGLKCGCPAAKSTPGAACGQDNAALKAEDRAGGQAREHRALYTERRIADAAVPGVILFLKTYWNIDFDLISLAEALLMDDVRLASGRTLRIEAGG